MGLFRDGLLEGVHAKTVLVISPETELKLRVNNTPSSLLPRS